MLRDPYQTDEWAKIKQEYGFEILKAGNTYLYVQRTPLGNFADIQFPLDDEDVVGRELRRIKPIFLSIFNDPQYSGCSFDRYGRLQEKIAFKVDLTPSVQQLCDNLKKQNRNAIRQAEKKGCEFRKGTTDSDFESFYRLYSELAKLKQFGILKKELMRRVFSSPIASLYITYANGEPAAVAFVLFSDTVARFWYGAGAPEFYAFRPSNFLHWNIMLEAKSKGCTYYDLSTASKDNIFKASFGSQPCQQEAIVHSTLRSRLIKMVASVVR